MRKNLPVTGVEALLNDQAMIVSRTNLKGIIEYANRDFIEISGFSEAELIGSPHNLVRHPDMPEEAFADFWQTLKSGRPWRGLVKNRCKNGDHYWVEANATPLSENGKLAGYMSVRFKPSREQVAAAEAAYRKFSEKKAAGLRILQGAVVRKSALDDLRRRFASVSFATRGLVLALSVAMVAGLAPWFVVRGATPMVVSIATSMLAFLAIMAQQRGLLRPLEDIHRHVREISEGQFRNCIDSGAGTEIGGIKDSLRTLQIKLGFDLAEARRATEEAMRIKVGLDNVATNVMIADRDLNIIYMNRSVREMMTAAEADLRRDLPSFEASRLIGTNIDIFHRDPAYQRALLAGLEQTHNAEVKVGGRVFSLTVVPVTDDRGVRLGTAVEWVDRTAEANVEAEINRIVQAAARGDFGERIGIEGKSGFFKALALGINQVLDTSATGLSETARVLEALAAGDLTARMQGAYEGTFAALQRDLNHTVDQLLRMVGDIREVAGQIHTAAQEVSQGNLDLSQRTEQQAAHLEETAASAEELTATVRNNAEHARQVQEIVLAARDSVNDTGRLVSQVVSTMRAIDQSSGKIVDIVALIDGIAFQTNILALNAAVEAARAGEQGRGFAVVASEVRSLAQKCAAAAKDVKSLINESTLSVASGTAQVDQAGEQIRGVIESVRKVEALTREISISSREQSAGVDQVAKTVVELDETTQRNAALVEQTSAAAASMEEQSHKLGELVAVFRLEATGPGKPSAASPVTVVPVCAAVQRMAA